MKKKLLAVAVAGALAAPGLALAQSSVTISGVFKMSLENLSIGSPVGARAGTRTKETRLSDDSSAIVFSVVEDLGGGLQAIAQWDMRIQPGSGTTSANGGNDHVGLRSKSLGRIFFGRQDLHYFNTESILTSNAGDLRASSVSLLAFIGGQAIASASRTPNVIHYTTPDFGGFTMIAAYSTSGQLQANGDIGSTVRAGNAWNLNPNFQGSNYQVGYSYWNAKQDGGGATSATGDQRADRIYGSFTMSGFKVGLAWDKSRIKSSIGATSGLELNNRTAWSLPISYIMGNNQFHFHYTKARDDKATVAQDGAKMVALSYNYTLSKRTSVGLTYAKITNDAGAAYNLFTSGSLGNSGAAATPVAGEDPRVIAATIRHAF